jgi:GNAT superfamily N-acetyltransferase
VSHPVTVLEWDSEFFGVPIARAEIADDTVAAAVDGARGLGVQCLYLVVPNAHPSSLEDAIRRGGRLVDLRLTLELEAPTAFPPAVREATPDDVALLVPHARRLSSSSRFRADPRFSPEAVEEMYEIWLERCGRDGVVIVPNESLEGFVGTRKEQGVVSVDLVYVDPTSRGRGVAARLVQAAVAGAQGRRARVATQAWNLAAQRLYYGLGVRPRALDAIVHLWLDENHPSNVTESVTGASEQPPSAGASTIRSTT